MTGDVNCKLIFDDFRLQNSVDVQRETYINACFDHMLVC